MPAMLGVPTARSDGQRAASGAAVIRRPSPPRGARASSPAAHPAVLGHAAFVAAALPAGTGAGMAGVLWGGLGVTLRAGTGAGMAGVLWGGGCVTLWAGTGAGMSGVLWGGACVTLRAGTGPGMAGVLWGAASATAGMLGGTGAGTRRPPPAATAPDALPSKSTPTSASGRPPRTRRKRDGLQSAGCAETSVLW